MCADLQIEEALKLGPKLGSVIAYHVIPGAYAADALPALGSSNTLLGAQLGTEYNLTFGTDENGKVCGASMARSFNPSSTELALSNIVCDLHQSCHRSLNVDSGQWVISIKMPR